MNYQDIIDKYYPEENELKHILLVHSRSVADKALSIVDRHSDLHLDRQFVEEAAMLHDIGIFKCNAPSIQCFGEEPYVCHGRIGAELLRREGYPRHARVCERHTGAGLTKKEIVFMFVIAFAMATSFVSALFPPFVGVAGDANVATVQQTKPAKRGGDTVRTTVDTTQMDSLQLAIFKHNKAVDDSIRVDSIMKSKSNGFEAPVTYSAEDSLVYDAKTRVAHLYGSAKMDYQNMKLSSDNVSMNLDSNLVRANGTTDSTAEGFNIKSKKGMIKGVYTAQDDGFLTGERAKRDSSGIVYIQHGRYTTCDKPHPDFYIALSRAKVRPGKDVVFGPAYLVVADVPLPLAIPYGFFPFSKKYSSGFIMPS